jgi:deferrochelatase/peroxidase EfeB
MGAGSVTGQTAAQPSGQPSKPSSWKLAPPHDMQTQGIVVSGFVDLPSAQALFLTCGWPDDPPDASPHKGAWLQTLSTVAPITDGDGKDDRSASIAFTWTGLQKSGLDPDALASFSAPFCGGMYQEDRLRRLGDRIKDKWQSSVIKDGPLWSGNTPVKDDRAVQAVQLPSGVVVPARDAPRQVTTLLTVHALLLLYDKDRDKVRAWADEVATALAPHHVTIVRRLDLDLHLDANGVAHEHFGFADGLSQPIPFDAPAAGEDGTVLVDGKPAPRDPWHGVPLGEILLGHTNAHAEKSPGPVVLDDGTGRQAALVPEGVSEGFLNFGLDGSYMVVRELRQYVGAFWKNLDANAQKIRAHDPAATHVTADWLAERVVGRDLNGHALCPAGVRAVDQNNQPDNAFGYFQEDRYGQGCPMGSHVRRANPRDGLARKPETAQTLLDAANNHRILRRGRKFGSPPKDRHAEDGEERGLLFICLNADIARQFEFVQQTWILNKNFATLYDETDPLVGPKGGFTIGEQPLRRIVDVETFIQLAGGEYFFLPSLPAVRYLASL